MKKILVMMVILATMSSYRGISETPAPVKEISGYRLKSNNIAFNDYNLWVITNREAFDKLFVAETETAISPGFDGEIVLAGKVETLSNSYSIQFKKTTIRRNELNVYFTVRREGPARDGTGPVSLVAFPRNASIKKVNFYHDNMLVRTIPIVAVY